MFSSELICLLFFINYAYKCTFFVNARPRIGRDRLLRVETSENWVDIRISTRKTDKFVLLVLVLILMS